MWGNPALRGAQTAGGQERRGQESTGEERKEEPLPSDALEPGPSTAPPLPPSWERRGGRRHLERGRAGRRHLERGAVPMAAGSEAAQRQTRHRAD